MTARDRAAIPRLLDPPPAGNVPELTVGELSGALKRTIEDRFGFVRVRGEISNYRGPHSSGHAYFCLKDETARIDAVIWKTAFQRIKVKPQEGLDVVATGRITTFPGKSTYQIVVESIEPAGVGALMALLDARRKALGAEGLFDEARKRPLPFLPGVVGVVTSPTGAVIRDILHRLADRFPRRVVVWPVRVQGETAAAEVAAAITGFNALSPLGAIPKPGAIPRQEAIPRPDVLIVARGGGSLEDLWAFNEEVVVRAAAAGTIPLISAVGHETDWTLIDHVADLRAPTPSGAAEKAVPVRADLRIQQIDLGRRRTAAMLRLIERRRADVRAFARALPAPDSVTAVPRQRLDRAETRLGGALTAGRDRRRLELARLAERLSRQEPRAKLARVRQELSRLEQRMIFIVLRARDRRASLLAQGAQRLASAALGLDRELARGRDRHAKGGTALCRAWRALSEARRLRLERQGRLLETLGYKQVLARGFALVRDAHGQPVRSAAAVGAEAALDIELADGHIEVVASLRAGAPASRKPRSGTALSSKPKVDQGTLF